MRSASSWRARPRARRRCRSPASAISWTPCSTRRSRRSRGPETSALARARPRGRRGAATGPPRDRSRAPQLVARTRRRAPRRRRGRRRPVARPGLGRRPRLRGPAASVRARRLALLAPCGTRQPPGEELRRALPPDRVGSVDVGPLDAGALHHVVQSHLGLILPRPVLDEVRDASGGNPFYALEIVRTLQRSGVSVDGGQPLPVPESLHDLVHGRLRGTATAKP